MPLNNLFSTHHHRPLPNKFAGKKKAEIPKNILYEIDIWPAF